MDPKRTLFAIVACVGLALVNVNVAVADEPDSKRNALIERSTIAVKVLVVNYDPIVKAQGNRRLHEVLRWNDPRQLAPAYIDDLEQATDRLVRHEIVKWIDTDGIPTKKDGFRYAVDDYLRLHKQRAGWHKADQVDYRRIIAEHGLVKLVDQGTIDEVWLFGGPYFGYWESTMAGPRAFYVNGPPVAGIQSKRPFVIMGFNYERGVAEMLHSLCHRVESTMSHFSGGWQVEVLETDWARFAANAHQSNGEAGCGTCHYPPNGERDYDYRNRRFVNSTADDWLTYPHLTGKKIAVNCETWGGPDYHRNYLRWWYARFPRAAGRHPHTGMLNNWWKYVYQFHHYRQNGVKNI